MADDRHRARISARTIPSWFVVVSVVLVVVAVVGFFVSASPDTEAQVSGPDAQVSTPASTAPASEPTKSPKNSTSSHKKKSKAGKSAEKQVPRAYVEIFNNTQITGLADSTSARVQGAGWKVVGTDNWYGNIPDTTVYYPKRLKKQAELLAEDLKIDRVRPAVDPMKFDRLTLILTGQV